MTDRDPAIVNAGGTLNTLLSAPTGFRNKIINGHMVIAQRGTSAVTGSGSAQWAVDRWLVYNNVGTVTFQQSSIAPAGFSQSLVATVTATGSYATLGYTEIGQVIEGHNIVDLAWGTSSAKPIVLSFWVRSSVTGTYNVVLQNNAQNRSYVTTFTINAQNTWEYKTIYINGDTSGSWGTDTVAGIRLWFNLGMGAIYDTVTANAWVVGNLGSTSGAVDFAANSGATFYVTGVQIEQNSQATPFEQRPIGVELTLCQRYYEKSYAQDTAPGTATSTGFVLAMTGGAQAGSSGIHDAYLSFKVEKRASATVVIYDTAGNINRCRRTAVGVANYDNQDVRDVNAFHNGCYFRSASGSGTTNTVTCHYTASAEL